jgi:hypothetical protein
MWRVLVGIALWGACSLSLAQSPSDRIEHFFTQVTTPASDQALEDLFAGSGLSVSKPQEIAKVKSQTKMAMGLYGTPIGLEKVREEDLSPSLKRLVYLQKFEKFPVAWEFYFYKASDKWVLNTLTFNDLITPLIGAKQ